MLLTGCAENPQGSPLSSASTEASETVSQPVSSAASENSEEMMASVSESAEGETVSTETAQTNLNVQVGDRTFTTTLEDNAVVDALVEKMEEAPIVLHLNNYSGFGKVRHSGGSVSDSQITTRPCLYQGN